MPRSTDGRNLDQLISRPNVYTESMCCWRSGQSNGCIIIIRCSLCFVVVQNLDSGSKKVNLCHMRSEPTQHSRSVLNDRHSHYHHTQTSKLARKRRFSLPDRVKTSRYLHSYCCFMEILSPQSTSGLIASLQVEQTCANFHTVGHRCKGRWFCLPRGAI